MLHNMLNSGDEAPLEQLVDFIVSAQSGVSSGGPENGDATNEVYPVACLFNSM